LFERPCDGVNRFICSAAWMNRLFSYNERKDENKVVMKTFPQFHEEAEFLRESSGSNIEKTFKSAA
jgi:hypothetical protein